jgi:hypothetical protein
MEKENTELTQFVTRGSSIMKIQYESQDSLTHCLEDLKKQVDSLVMTVEKYY